MELRLLYGKDYHYYHFEEVKNQYGKVLEYQIVENNSNILSMKPANMIFTRDNGKYCGTDIIYRFYSYLQYDPANLLLLLKKMLADKKSFTII